MIETAPQNRRLGYARVNTNGQTLEMLFHFLTLFSFFAVRVESMETSLQSPPPPIKSALRAAFTLIELSIALVIIGLIVGGVLVGQDLIKAAEVRATLTQVEKYNMAANTFYGKYGFLPGDLPANVATQFGFAARGLYNGEGDGNGLIEGLNGNTTNANFGSGEAGGETQVFWVDLSAANMIDGSFTAGSESNVATISNANFPLYFPAAKIGQGNYF